MSFTENAESNRLVFMEFRMADFAPGGALVTREKGDEARRALAWQLRSGHPSADPMPVVLDFTGVIATSVPFADEFLGKLLAGRSAGYYEEHPIWAVGLLDDVAETIDVVLRTRRLYLVAMVEDGPRAGPRLLGADDLLWETFDAAAKVGTFRVSDLAEELHISPQAMNNRLKPLLRSGALRRSRSPRTRGGKEFEYQIPAITLGHWTDADLAGQSSLFNGGSDEAVDSSNGNSDPRPAAGHLD